MKKVLCLLILVVFSISLVACGNDASSSSVLNVNTTASTDIVSFKIIDSSLATYVGATTNDSFLLPSKTKTTIGAPVGKSLVSISFKVTNNDRAGYLNINSSSKSLKEKSLPLDWKLTYKGRTYDITSFTYSYDHIGFTPGAFINGSTGEVLDTISTSNYLLGAKESCSFRVIGVVDMEPDSYEDTYSITVKLPNSKGKKEKFTYTVNP
ncbi:MAG: hypothetical protein E7621_07275 [Ruminococcaceae bacterium]|nr:hypothetical protein [Oscillospiraceae bacterium]